MRTGTGTAWEIACGETSEKPEKPKSAELPGVRRHPQTFLTLFPYNFPCHTIYLLYASPLSPPKGVRTNTGDAPPPASSTACPIARARPVRSLLALPRPCACSHRSGRSYPLLNYGAVAVAAAAAITGTPPGNQFSPRGRSNAPPEVPRLQEDVAAQWGRAWEATAAAI